MKKDRISKAGFAGGFVKLTLLLTLVLTLIMMGLSGAAGRAKPSSQRVETKDGSEALQRKIPDLKVAAAGGSFTLSDLRLVKASGSTKLKGEISNDTARGWKRATFELKAFDDKGNQLKGAEDVIIFQINDLERTASMPIDDGYGVWLEGIPFESISKIEAILIEGGPPAAYWNKTTAGRPGASATEE
jgi:hypothetical protein